MKHLPRQFVAIINPEVGRFAQRLLDSIGVPDLTDKNALGAIGLFAPRDLRVYQ